MIEQFADLSFIPCSFVAKDGSRKKRRSVKSPNVDTPATVSNTTWRPDDYYMMLHSVARGSKFLPEFIFRFVYYLFIFLRNKF